MKSALITGIFGQDGSYLAELLTACGYEVHGLVRESFSVNANKIKHYLTKLGICPKLHAVDLNNYHALKDTLIKIKPSEVYHLAALHVSSQKNTQEKAFFEKQLFDYNVKSTSNILSICYDFLQDTKIFIAGSCLMFDNSKSHSQDEQTQFDSKSLYGLAKITENALLKYYRNKELFACSGILYNHESSRRQEYFVSKKIVKNMCAIKKGEINKFILGNLTAQKDWGYAKDYVKAMHLMLQQAEASDFILASGKLYSVKDIIVTCADILNIDNWQKYVEVDKNILDREVNAVLLGDNTKAKDVLNWSPTLSFRELIELMIKNELSGEFV